MKKEKRLHGNIMKRLGCICLILAICMPVAGCGQAWDHLWGRGEETDVNSNLLVIPGSGTPEDPSEFYENAVEYTGEVHEGTNIYYPNPNKGPNREKIIVIDAGHQAEGDSAQEPMNENEEESK